LKTRDQRQLDFEDLTGFLKEHIAERDKIIRTGDPNASSNVITHFINKKMDELKGVDQNKAKQLKLEKLEAKIAEVKSEEKIDFSFKKR
jgi:sorting nexin-4